MLNQLLWWYGYVTDINDPLQMGRVRVVVRNHYEDLPPESVPWARVFGNATNYEGVGDFIPLAPNTEVIGYFEDGLSKKKPVVMASMQNIPRMDNSRHSVSPLARGEQVLGKEPLADSPEPPSPYAAEYPYNRTITTKGGHAIELDDTPGNERIHIYHSAGAYIEINKEGRIVVKSKDSSFEIVEKDKHLQVNGNLNVRVKGDLNSLTEGDVTVTALGNMTYTSDKSIFFRAKQGVKIETPADVVVKAVGGLNLTKGGLSSLGPIQMAGGITGCFTATLGKQVQVSKGIITNISTTA